MIKRLSMASKLPPYLWCKLVNYIPYVDMVRSDNLVYAKLGRYMYMYMYM